MNNDIQLTENKMGLNNREKKKSSTLPSRYSIELVEKFLDCLMPGTHYVNAHLGTSLGLSVKKSGHSANSDTQ